VFESTGSAGRSMSIYGSALTAWTGDVDEHLREAGSAAVFCTLSQVARPLCDELYVLR
jgi:hypothetical protein